MADDARSIVEKEFSDALGNLFALYLDAVSTRAEAIKAASSAAYARGCSEGWDLGWKAGFKGATERVRHLLSAEERSSLDAFIGILDDPSVTDIDQSMLAHLDTQLRNGRHRPS